MRKHTITILLCACFALAGWLVGTAQERARIQTGTVTWNDARSIKDDWGEMRVHYHGESFGASNAFAAVAVVEPGKAVHPAHRHAEEEFIVLTQGSGRWHLDGKDFPATKGDVMYIEPWKFHGLVNTSDEPLEFFVVKWHSKGIALPPEPEGDHGR